jgi:hypothetical protein
MYALLSQKLVEESPLKISEKPICNISYDTNKHMYIQNNSHETIDYVIVEFKLCKMLSFRWILVWHNVVPDSFN